MQCQLIEEDGCHLKASAHPKNTILSNASEVVKDFPGFGRFRQLRDLEQAAAHFLGTVPVATKCSWLWISDFFPKNPEKIFVQYNTNVEIQWFVKEELVPQLLRSKVWPFRSLGNYEITEKFWVPHPGTHTCMVDFVWFLYGKYTIAASLCIFNHGSRTGWDFWAMMASMGTLPLSEGTCRFCDEIWFPLTFNWSFCYFHSLSTSWGTPDTGHARGNSG